MYDLSILIPSRNELFLARTIQDILDNIQGRTEIIVVLDGQWPEIPLPVDSRLTVVYHPFSVGQRAATNDAARLSSAKYLIKCDSHCAFDKGFDVKLMEAMDGHDDWTVVPIMRNLHAFDWVCPDGHRRYQGPSGPCGECGKETVRDVVWIAKTSPQSKAYCFDSEPHFQYHGDFSKRPEGKGDITPTMSLQGSFFMLTRDRYWALNISDEAFGSWGSQGVEVACKTWLSGGSVMVVHTTWYAHMFRTQGGDFSFPYEQKESRVKAAKVYARSQFFDGEWKGAVRPLSWLVDKFWPVPGWSDDDRASIGDHNIEGLSRGIIYYSDGLPDPAILKSCQETILSSGLPIMSATLVPMDFGENIYVNLERGYLTMFRQILAALEKSTADIVYFCEHDVLYHKSHFDLLPRRKDTYYYNMNCWQLRMSDGHAVYYDCKRLSGLFGYRDMLITHYKERIRRVESEGFSRKMGFEPGTHGRAERVDDLKAEGMRSEFPNIDLRHDRNLTGSRWSQSEFRSQRNCQGWIESDEIPGWGKGEDIVRLVYSGSKQLTINYAKV